MRTLVLGEPRRRQPMSALEAEPKGTPAPGGPHSRRLAAAGPARPGAGAC